MNLGAGRIVYQDFTRITRAIETGDFAQNPVLCHAVDAASAQGKAVHIMGLLSPGGVHSHQEHIKALVTLAAERGAEHIYLHAFLDGRDTPPKSAAAPIAALETCFSELGHGRIASLAGRYYAMDRDQRWERVEQAYNLLVAGQAEYTATTAEEGLEQAYQRGETDEFVKATAIVPAGTAAVSIDDGDCVIFANFRADRARQLSRVFTEPDFDGFSRGKVPKLSVFVCMTQYHRDIAADVAFPPTDLHNSLGEIVARQGLRQLRIAETEKYAHVTFFFNGGEETTFPGEERILVPSPKVATYDLQPEMSAPELTRRLVDAIRSGSFDVIVCNYANPDMVGHTGLYQAAVSAVETIDQCLGQIYEALREVNGEMLITADHGNLEMMQDPQTGQPHTAHTTNPVPLIYMGRPAGLVANGTGALCDIAPTILQLLAIPQPEEMTGHSLVTLKK
jgi:2,3-bisphosphoglycerate-independent phosphoglycerate mutase